MSPNDFVIGEIICALPRPFGKALAGTAPRRYIPMRHLSMNLKEKANTVDKTVDSPCINHSTPPICPLCCFAQSVYSLARREVRRQNAHECSVVERNFAAASHHMRPGDWAVVADQSPLLELAPFRVGRNKKPGYSRCD
jgi:hypothetical protein